MAIKPFEIQSPSLVLAGVQMQAGTTGVVIPGVTQATTYTVNEVDDTGDQTDTWGSVPTVIDNGRYTILNGGSEPAGYTISEYVVEELDGDGYIDDIEVTEVGAFPSSYESTVTQNMWATTVADPFTSFNPADWTQIPFAPQVRAGDVENVGGGSGYIIPYEVATFEANTQPGFGEIQFADNEGGNSAPSTAQKLFINQGAQNEQSLGTIFQQWTSNSYRGTLSLNNGSDSQATFNISNGRIYFNPETYRGFNAGLNQIWGDDCSINQLIITNATAPKFYNTDFLVEDDVFHATGLDTGNTHVMLNVYGSSQYNPINPQDLWNMFVAFVDGVLYDGETLRTDTSAIKSAFYNNGGNFTNNIPTQDLFQYFRFTETSGADYFASAPTTTNGAGDGATLRLRVNADGTYVLLGITNAGVGYQVGDTLTVLGTDLGGTSPANDLVVTVGTVDGSGSVTVITYTSGTGVYPWPPNFISDGSDDQYDTGNYLNTNLATEISYANGLPQTDSAAFDGGDYCVMYNPSFFCMVATGTGSSMNELFYSGNLGFDGDGDLNWTGLRNNQSVIANNNALYAYFDSEYLDGDLTPTVGTTYNMVLDSAGINLDGFYAYNDDNTGDTFFGSNNDWRVESQSQLYVQSYNQMLIQTLVNQRGIGEAGPALTVQAGSGSPGQKEINATAGNGGTVYVRGGNAGTSDEIDSLGNTGGRVEISGGLGTGNSQAGNIEISGGEGNNSGSINLRTDYGSNSTGKITLNTGGSGTTNTWEFRPDGSTIYPTLTVTRGDRTGTLTGQTILFGNSAQEAILTTSNGTSDINDSQRLVINPGAGYANTTGEGGDIYLYAGRGGDAGGSGGDIKIRGGLGPVDGAGGYIDITGGEAAGNGAGGYIDILGGQSANSTGGRVRIEGGQGISGAEANIRGGTGSAGPGGAVNIAGGTSSNGVAEYGNVNITAGASTWTFDNTGNLVLPTNDFTVNYANGTQVNIGGGGSANTGNVTFDDVTIQGVNGLNLSAGPDFTASLAYLQVRAGDVASHIHLDTGNNAAYDLIVGDDQKFVQVSNTGNIIMSSYDGNTSYTMTLDTTGNVTFPGVLGVVGGTTTPVTGNNEAGNPGVSGSQTFNAQVSYFPTVGDIQVGWTVTGNNLTGTTTVTVVDEYSPGFFEITTDTSVTNAFWYGDAYTFTGTGTSNWVFANDNILTFPRDEIANTDPYLRIEGGTNPRILSEDASLAGPANLEITALNTIFTGSTGSEIRIYPDDGEVGSTGNLELWANAGSNVAQYNWTFDTTGNLTVPGNTTVSTANATSGAAGKNISVIAGAADQSDYYTTSGGNVNITGGLGAGNDGGGGGPGGWVNITSGASADPAGVYGNVKINTGGANTWTFDYTGNLTLPGNAFAVNYANGTQVSLGGGGAGGNAISDGDSNVTVTSTNGNVAIGVNNNAASWTFAVDGIIYNKSEADYKVLVSDPNDDGYGVKHYVNDGTQDLSTTSLEADNFRIYTDLPGGGYEWRFNRDTLQVSNNSFIRGFDSNVTIQSMYAGSNGTASLQSVSNANDPNVFSTFDATTTGANIKIYNGGSNSGVEYSWQFDNTGNLTLPGNTFSVNYANGTAVSLGGGSSYGDSNVSTFLAAYGSNTVSTTGNVTSGNINTGGVVSASGNVRGANFNTVGLISATGNITGNYIIGNGSQLTSLPSPTPTEDTGNTDAFVMVTSGALNYTGHVTIKPLSGDITTLGNISTGTLSASGNVTAGNISTSGSNGNITGANVITATTLSATGTVSNLVRRAYTIAAANTAVTLDNIQARIGGSPTRLFINTVTGNLTGAGTSETMTSGSMAVSSWINVPIGEGAANAFAMSGAVSVNGDTAILNLIDQGSGTGMWRVTGMIANTAGNLYGITIERLV